MGITRGSLTWTRVVTSLRDDKKKILVLIYLLGIIKTILVWWNLNIQLPGSRQWKLCPDTQKYNDERLLLLQGWQRVSRIKNMQK